MLATIGRAARAFSAWAKKPFVGAAVPGTQAGPPPSHGPAAASSREPHFRSYTEWTPQLIRSVLPRVDGGGELRWAADLFDAVLGDDRAKSVFETRTGGLLGSPLEFEESTAGHRTKRKQALKALEAQEDWWFLCPEDELSRLVTWGLGVGAGFATLENWHENKDHGGRLVATLKVWHPRWFKWDHEQQSWFAWTTANQWEKVTPGDGRWVVYTPYGKSRPWAYGLWRGLSVLWLLKVYALRDIGLFSELHGTPAWVLTGEPDFKKRKALADLFLDLARNPAVALPPNVKAELLEAKADTWEVFTAQVELANRGFAVAVVGGNLAVEVDGNQQTGATAQTLVRIDYKKRDAASVSTMAHDQVLYWWAEWNFGDARVAGWPIWNVEPPEDTAAVAKTWFTIGQALEKFTKAGIVVDLKATAERFAIPIVGVKQPEPDEKTSDEDGDKAAPDDEDEKTGAEELEPKED
ncbi:MAG: DUF935 family protein [Polyangiaceae bacterium]|nr:DUF935 family protein [Polyangiaceae bacterium]